MYPDAEDPEAEEALREIEGLLPQPVHLDAVSARGPSLAASALAKQPQQGEAAVRSRMDELPSLPVIAHTLEEIFAEHRCGQRKLWGGAPRVVQTLVCAC